MVRHAVINVRLPSKQIQKKDKEDQEKRPALEESELKPTEGTTQRHRNVHEWSRVKRHGEIMDETALIAA